MAVWTGLTCFWYALHSKFDQQHSQFRLLLFCTYPTSCDTKIVSICYRTRRHERQCFVALSVQVAYFFLLLAVIATLFQWMTVAFPATSIFPVLLPSRRKVNRPHWRAALPVPLVLASRLAHGLKFRFLLTKPTVTVLDLLHISKCAHCSIAVIHGRMTPIAICLIGPSAAITVLRHLWPLLHAKMHLEYLVTPSIIMSWSITFTLTKWAYVTQCISTEDFRRPKSFLMQLSTLPHLRLGLYGLHSSGHPKLLMETKPLLVRTSGSSSSLMEYPFVHFHPDIITRKHWNLSMKL